LIDSDESNSDNEDDSFRLDNTATGQKAQKSRDRDFKVPEIPMAAEQDLDDADDIYTLYGKYPHLLFSRQFKQLLKLRMIRPNTRKQTTQ
jgi:hypothetical protein